MTNSHQDTPDKVLTLNQYMDRLHRDAAARHDIPIAEAARELPTEAWRGEWEKYVYKAFGDGADISTTLWRSFDWRTQRALLRTTRALRNPEVTRALVAKTVHNAARKARS